MSKRKFKKQESSGNSSADKQVARANARRLIATVVVTLVVLLIYRLMMNTPYFYAVFIAYLVLAAAAVLGYVIYNRGFSRKGLTVDMLPPEWDEQKKREYIEDGEIRLKRSRNLLIIVIAFGFTFAIDVIELFTIPLIMELFTK